MKLAILYAGQGSQHPGMGKDLYERYPAFREAFNAADLDFDLESVCFDDPEGVLNLTQYTQPCMVAFAAGVTAVLKENGVKADDLAGLSLGEYSALGCVQICNYNCPGQLVVGGEKAAVEKATELAKAAGARRCIPLKVSGPFHTRLMHPAGDALAKRFVSEHFGEMETPVLFNCLGREKADSDSIPALLEKQVQSSVYMEDTLRRLGELGVTDILEVGPGKALSGFVKKTLGADVHCTAVETAEELEAFLTSWKEAQA